MWIIVGLGNPGDQYEGTRHNAGFAVVTAFAATHASDASSKPWKLKRILHAELVEYEVANQRVLLAKPTTFMNESGKAVAAIVNSLQRTTDDARLLIVHDDLDLPIGALRLSENGSSGGQKGVQSIIDALGTKDFLRLRIGIGPNATPEGIRIPAENFVLKHFASTERTTIDAVIARATKTITTLLCDGISAAQQLANH